MAQKFDYPKSETDLQETIDKLYSESRDTVSRGDLPRFKGLLEIMSAEPTILSAIHKLKRNKGSETPGSDSQRLRRDILQQDYQIVISRVQECFKHYRPNPVRRVYIPKPGKREKRPLGIPTIIDRIVQECIRMVIEPILEAQFFKHSYGFRPMRDADMALARTTTQVKHTGYHWIIEGDISKFFDNVNHSILLRKLWHMGIRDQRVLMIIKGMLKAGIMDEMKTNQLGTPQGGIISPLLANAYLDTFDQWLIREWEEKKTRHPYTMNDNRLRALRNHSNLKPAYLVRYADDWVLITNTKSSAEKWKRRISRFLDVKLKLKLSEEKTLITDVRKRPIQFVGFNFKERKNGPDNWVTSTRPNPERLRSKIDEIRSATRNLRRVRIINNVNFKEQLVSDIHRLNSKIRGVVNYYESSTMVNVYMAKYANSLNFLGRKVVAKYGGGVCPAKEVYNLQSIHASYDSKIPFIQLNDWKIGITDFRFCKWKKGTLKNPDESPFTKEGRLLYEHRSLKRPVSVRADEILSHSLITLLAIGKTERLYTFEYFLNRPYAFNRDKGKCRVCGNPLSADNIHVHHINPALPPLLVNRIPNLASVHIGCHRTIHSDFDFEYLGSKIWRKILGFREKLNG
ncbi:group II intron reverse transcriptase/maturase [Paenibacillus sp. FSL A5-0031]|uniref:group II intron reverse transcriptase/maturase n=1 Tax=Paenibacillus sp. FSL A5-0031 TaxID=1920420 RepID=UPI00096EDE1F|nr:group II intron reverse transcriptase/maturase [Paenibacillus sp. FSL A5-0031]OME69179.1 group II intron reverse transcriptase/maturase [Paenibacillus sp. FSL A5-0031]